ncbi:hypothetical protein X271_00145 [Candidatus Hepatoplasma crinochetorum Av]|uniref:Uncharacterized protein n=1 Tax=Candidatus Hepatoplasma crinochetorum Av TaxID=1427984 RepID=W8GEN0_9MOLU|nr:hypothetical protein [Candidatus Hepatoplasma crinochetorum]AHK22254.1 hypothetical protein X271_00145 [Candidatus Hepatoplasma crinochetorum Av]
MSTGLSIFFGFVFFVLIISLVIFLKRHKQAKKIRRDERIRINERNKQIRRDERIRIEEQNKMEENIEK